MILKALYDYYHRKSDLPAFGMELKEIGFVIVIDRNGKFVRFEDRRIDKKSAQKFLVKKSVGRSSAPVANYLYDNSQYVFGYSDKGDMESMSKYFDTFKEKVREIHSMFPDNDVIKAVYAFYKVIIYDNTLNSVVTKTSRFQLGIKIFKAFYNCLP